VILQIRYFLKPLVAAVALAHPITRVAAAEVGAVEQAVRVTPHHLAQVEMAVGRLQQGMPTEIQ
jgi:hypothetical protein